MSAMVSGGIEVLSTSKYRHIHDFHSVSASVRLGMSAAAFAVTIVPWCGINSPFSRVITVLFSDCTSQLYLKVVLINFALSCSLIATDSVLRNHSVAFTKHFINEFKHSTGGLKFRFKKNATKEWLEESRNYGF